MRNNIISSLAGATFSFAASGLAFATPPPVPAPIYSWTGFYAGLNAGWSWGDDNTTVNFPGPVITGATFNNAGATCIPGPCKTHLAIVNEETTHPNGAIGGVQIGYNWQTTSNWILGVEADIQASGENASGNNHQTEEGVVFVGNMFAPQSISHNDALLWFGTVRGRVGYAIWADGHVVRYRRIGLWQA